VKIKLAGWLSPAPLILVSFQLAAGHICCSVCVLKLVPMLLVPAHAHPISTTNARVAGQGSLGALGFLWPSID
jgi:hypothetical protein